MAGLCSKTQGKSAGVKKGADTFHNFPIIPFNQTVMFWRVRRSDFMSDTFMGETFLKPFASKFSATICAENLHVMSSVSENIAVDILKTSKSIGFLSKAENILVP